jgi:molybdopterin-guanine dinucleotide biosynthesis protein A
MSKLTRYNHGVPLLGIFVGGQSSRMGGTPKGLLRAPHSTETLIARLARIARDAGLQPLLVGAAPLGELGATLPGILDHEPRLGPLSGLASLLDHAATEPCIAVACDMPHVSAALLRRLLLECPDAPVLAPRDPSTGKWQPLCARYHPSRPYSRARSTPALDRFRTYSASFRSWNSLSQILNAPN